MAGIDDVLERELMLMIDGQPPKALKAGESYPVPPGAAHDARTGTAGAKVLGKPLASPVP